MGKTREQIAADWYELINHTFYDFRGDTRKTISDFADWFDHMPQGQMSAYMKKGGKIPKTAKMINVFAKKIGPVVYEVLDVPAPSVVMDPFEGWPPNLRDAGLEIKASLEKLDVSWDSPEGQRIVTEILQAHGLK